MAIDTTTETETIRRLNDAFRKTSFGGKHLLTPGVTTLSAASISCLLDKVAAFDAFSEENDPHGEHDFGSIDHEGERYFWKIDYYAPDLEHGSENPADPAETVRILTLMRADEY